MGLILALPTLLLVAGLVLALAGGRTGRPVGLGILAAGVVLVVLLRLVAA